MKLKKVLAAALAASMALSIVACGSSNNAGNASGSNASGSNGSGNPTYELKISTTQTNTSMIYQGL